MVGGAQSSRNKILLPSLEHHGHRNPKECNHKGWPVRVPIWHFRPPTLCNNVGEMNAIHGRFSLYPYLWVWFCMFLYPSTLGFEISYYTLTCLMLFQNWKHTIGGKILGGILRTFQPVAKEYLLCNRVEPKPLGWISLKHEEHPDIVKFLTYG